MPNNHFANSKIALFTEKWLPFLTAVLMPLYPMLYLYNQEGNSQYLSLLQVLALSLALMLLSFLMFLIANHIIKKPHASVFICLPAWIAFFSYGQIYLVLSDYGVRQRHVLLILAIIVCFIWVGINFISKKFCFRIISLFIGFLLIILLLVNIVQSAYYVSPLANYTGNDVVYKTTFVTDDTLASPNVYWFHCDGMLGFDAMEKYFGDSQDEFAQELEKRGFIINREAQFEAFHSTQAAIPTLMNPHFYDNWLKHNSYPMEAIIYQLLSARQKNELVLAFNTRYHTATISGSDLGFYFFPITNVFYDYTREENPLMTRPSQSNNTMIVAFDKASNLATLLQIISPIGAITKLEEYIRQLHTTAFSYHPINSQIETASVLWSDTVEVDSKSDESLLSYKTLARCLDDALSIEESQFLLISYLMAHNPFIYDENGLLHGKDPWDIQNYPLQHRYAGKVLLNFVDMILKRDPDAVIVLQADHGIHRPSAQQIAEALSVSEDAAPDIWNGVMSAVRIPERYGELEEPLHPLDITRYLVNNYVGENYEYLEKYNH